MSTRRILKINFAMASGRFAGHRTGDGQKSGDAEFKFNPDAWVHMAYPCRETAMCDIGGKQVRRKARFSVEGFRKMIAAFEADKAERAAQGFEHSLLGNKDHLALMRENSTEAYGWLDGLRLDDKGHLWGHIKWSSLGIEAARGGVYRFVSVEVEDVESDESDTDAELEWNRITGFAVTNQPALEDLIPYCHRDSGEEIEKEEKTNQPKGKKMETIKQILGLDHDATQEAVEEKLREWKAAVEQAANAAAEAEMSKKAAAFSKKHGSKFKDEAAAMAFYRSAPEQAEAMVGRFRVIEADADAEALKLESDARAFAAAHSAKFGDEAGAVAFYKANPEQAEELAGHIRVPTASHRGGGNPDKKGGGAMTPKAAHSKWKGMPEGAEKEKFFDENVELINKGGVEASQE